MKRKPGKISIRDIENYPEYLERQIRVYKSAEKKWAEDILNLLFQDKCVGKKRILDAGSGAGIMTSYLVQISQKKGLDTEVIGIDNFPAMIAFAQERAERERIQEISFLEGDVTNMPFPDNYFDLVTATFLFFFLSEEKLPKFLNETYRVLKNGGKFHFFHPQRNRFVYTLTWILTRGRKKYELDTIRHSYTPTETKELIKQSSLSNGNFKARKKWGPLMIEAFGTINKPSSK